MTKKFMEKSDQRYLKSRFNRVFMILLVIFSTETSAQSNIGIRFANPVYDCDNETYCLDVEYSSNTNMDTLFGTNVRFFYNSTVMTFIDLRNFELGYAGTALANSGQVGSADSGEDMFNFDPGDPATWINWGVELQNVGNGKLIGENTWTKFYEACFTITGSPEAMTDFCPEIVWDLEENIANGGFLIGDDGVVITVQDGNLSEAVDEVVDHYNWDYSGGGSAPFGDYVNEAPEGCLTYDCGCTIVAPVLSKTP